MNNVRTIFSVEQIKNRESVAIGVATTDHLILFGVDPRISATPNGLYVNGIMMTSSNGNIFRVTVHLCGEFTGHRWILRTKASDADLWCLFLCAFE